MSLSPARESMAREALARFLGPAAAARATITPLGDGLINETFLVEGDHSALPDDGLPPPTRSVLQRVNPLFDISVHEDIEAITRHLASRGLPTLRLYRSAEGELAVEVEGRAPVAVVVDVPRVVPAEAVAQAPEAEAEEAEEPAPEGDGPGGEDLASTASQPTLFTEDEDTSEIWVPADDHDDAGADERTGEMDALALAVDDDDPLERTGEVDVPALPAGDDDPEERTGEVDVPMPPDEDPLEPPLPPSARRVGPGVSAPPGGDDEPPLAPGSLVRWEQVTRIEQRPDRGVYRLCSYVPGRTVTSVAAGGGVKVVREAGRLVARFHEALLGLQHEFAFTRPAAHHLPTHLNNLLLARQRAAGGGALGPDGMADFDALAEEIIERISEHPMEAPGPARICHGDLKISNLRFDEAGRGLCLLDLDTLAYLPLVVELGDALRSWCNGDLAAEDSPDGRFDLALFEGALHGYAERARAFLQPEERAGLVQGVERIALELAARFAADVVNDRYFGWNREKFPSRAAHNLVRAQGQLSLARSIAAQRAPAEAIVTRLLG